MSPTARGVRELPKLLLSPGPFPSQSLKVEGQNCSWEGLWMLTTVCSEQAVVWSRL